jgi:hypothetical protein
MPDAFTNPTSSPASSRNGSKTLSVFFGVLLVSAPLGVAMSVGYRALFALEAWALNSPYAPEDLEFLQPEKIVAAILWTYIICAVPVIVTATMLSSRAWTRGTFRFAYGAIVAGASMAAYMAIVAYISRHELVSVVTEETAFNGVVYAVLVSIVTTALLRWTGLIARPA